MEPAKKLKGRVRANVHTVINHDQIRHLYVYTAPVGHTIDDMLSPEYWSNEAKKFRLFDRIELRAEDMSFWAEAIVIARGEVSVKLHILQAHDLTDSRVTMDKKMADEYKVEHKGLKGFVVIRKSDNAVISDKHDNRENAMRALQEYLQAFGK